MSDLAIPYAVELAARKLGCQAEELLAWKVHSQPDRVVVVAPTGQKFTFSQAEIEAIDTQLSAKSCQRSAKSKSKATGEK
jgi:hypothetical protein